MLQPVDKLDVSVWTYLLGYNHVEVSLEGVPAAEVIICTHLFVLTGVVILNAAYKAN